jgi:hypothetical protein
MKLMFMLFSLASCYFHPHSYKNSLAPFSKSLSFLNVSDQVCHTYQTIRKFIVVSLIIPFIDRRGEMKDSQLKGTRFYHISFVLDFFVSALFICSVVPTCLNVSQFH